eukprot:1541160-Pyramimonas_sp.AAC.1
MSRSSGSSAAMSSPRELAASASVPEPISAAGHAPCASGAALEAQPPDTASAGTGGRGADLNATGPTPPQPNHEERMLLGKVDRRGEFAWQSLYHVHKASQLTHHMVSC